LGIRHSGVDAHGIVTAALPPTAGRHNAPTVAFFAHLDTSPETSGKDVRPVVHHKYDGRNIHLPRGTADLVIRTAENPDLMGLIGGTIITTDGTTLLGADDKAGVAVMMETAAYLRAHPEIPRGIVKFVFTCDEEIGRGVDHVDLKALEANVGYTLDGDGRGTIDCETFSADLAVVTAKGVNIHPSIGKGRMVNAVRALSEFVARLPQRTLSPETTDARQGFLHPYKFEGGVAEASVRILLRDFDTPKLAEYAAILRETAAQVAREFPGASFDVKVTPQYRNMADGLAKEPRAVEFAEQAMRRAGMTPERSIIRGGTDGSRLTEMGLPTPNLSTGEHNPHSPLEWTSVEEMRSAVDVCVELVRLWADAGTTD
jgi:tripeptide aminopeptidase